MERFGRYVLLEPIAVGGTAEVFRAAALGSAGFHKTLAIKRVLPHLAADPEFVRMLVDEAHIASALQHPNILQVLDLGTEGASTWLAMEFVAGRALNKVLEAAVKQGITLPMPFCVHVIVELLRALNYAHAQTDPQGRPLGIIHRDVSPHNVMVAYEGNVKLGDFGIAKLSAINPNATGPIKGKPGYMAPEQVTGGVVDQRADLHAAGVVAFELLTMRKLHADDNPVRTILEVAKGIMPRFEDRGVDVPFDLAQVIYQALEPQPSNRWNNAQAFLTALEDTSRAHGWHHNTADVAVMMRTLFAQEMEEEARKQEHFRGIMSELAQASSATIPLILQRAAVAPAGERTQPALAPVRKGPGTATAIRRGARQVAAALGGVAAVAALAGVVWFNTRVAGAEPPAVQLAELVVETTPPGATVLIDGVKQDRSSPVVVKRGLGAAAVEAQLPGHQAARGVVILDGTKPRTVSLVLQPLAVVATLPVHSTPQGAQVLLDGKPQGQTPLILTLTGDKALDITLSLPGHGTVKQSVIPANAPARLDVTLQRAPERVVKVAAGKPPPRNEPASSGPPVAVTPAVVPEPQVPGRLTLQSRPWARILLDGKDTGRFTPVAEMTVAAGEHVVELVNDEDRLSARFTVTIKPGVVTSVTRTLQ